MIERSSVLRLIAADELGQLKSEYIHNSCNMSSIVIVVFGTTYMLRSLIDHSICVHIMHAVLQAADKAHLHDLAIVKAW